MIISIYLNSTQLYLIMSAVECFLYVFFGYIQVEEFGGEDWQ